MLRQNIHTDKTPLGVISEETFTERYIAFCKYHNINRFNKRSVIKYYSSTISLTNTVDYDYILN